MLLRPGGAARASTGGRSAAWVALAAILAGAAAFTLDARSRGIGVGREAAASVSVLMTLDELVSSSDEVVVARAVERKSRWEDLPSGRRIVTYTRLQIDETLAGTERSELWVRTLGGVVDKIGQQVSGEAQIALDRRAVLFLAEIDDGSGHGVTIVTGMAQGHFPLDESGSEPKLAPSPDRGALLPRRGPSISAAEVLVDQPISVARKRIAESADRAGKRRPK
jgi:hypothetical protein